MQDQQERHRAGLTQSVEQQAAEAHETQEPDEGDLSPEGLRRAERPVGPELQPDHLGATQHQQQTTGNP